MRRIVVVACIAAAAAAAAAPALAQVVDGKAIADNVRQAVSRINRSIDVPAGTTASDQTTVNGSIRIGARSTIGDAHTVNGSIRLGAQVTADNLQTVNGGIHIGERSVVSTDAQTVNGEVLLERGARVQGGVSNVNGGIGLIAAQVGGDVSTVCGDVTIGVGSVVRGRVHIDAPNGSSRGCRKMPKVIIGPHAQVIGGILVEQAVQVWVHRSARAGKITGPATVTAFDGARP